MTSRDTVARVLRRDAYWCQLGLPGCTGEATQVQPVSLGDPQDPASLRASCRACASIEVLAPS